MIAVLAVETPNPQPMDIPWILFGFLCALTLGAVCAALFRASDRWDGRVKDPDAPCTPEQAKHRYTTAQALMPLWGVALPVLAVAAVLGYLIVGLWVGSWRAYNDALPRLAVASNPSAAPETLDRLVDDDIEAVRLRLTRNRATAPETLDRLAGDESRKVRVRVASNPRTWPETLDRLAGDESEAVRAAACAQYPASTQCDALHLAPSP